MRGVRVASPDGEDVAILELEAIESPEVPALTAAERAIVALLVRGLSSVEIAHARGTSPRTVACQLASIYRKLGVSSRGEVTAALRRISLAAQRATVEWKR